MISEAFLGAVGFAVSAGVATFFAPCAFPLLPGYVGYYVQQGQDDDASDSGMLSAGVAAVGALAALGGVAGLAFAFGQRLTATLPLLEPVIGVGLVAFGALVLVGRAPRLTVALPARPTSLAGFGVFGAVYALAAAGCVVPLFLGVVTQALAFAPLPGGLVLAAYAAAVAAPLVGVTLLASHGIDAWRTLGAYTGRVERVAAVVMIAAGVGQLYLSIVVLDVL